MKIIILGSGSREHALAYALGQEHDVVCAPGNPGIARTVQTADLNLDDFAAVALYCRNNNFDLAVVGPEDPLILGIADVLNQAGIPTYGPGAAAARLEGSKAFSKELMAEAGVPTAAFAAFDHPEPAIEYARQSFERGIGVAVKASGNALGKGVAVCPTFDEAKQAIDRMMVEREFGSAGDTVVVEEMLIGREFSLLTLVGDKNFVHLPVAQDYKRVFDGDQGPNTGGMGSFSPCPWVTPELVKEVEETMVRPILEALKAKGPTFRGTLFTGVIVTAAGPRCLEYNVRFGDPETQSIMMRHRSGLGLALYQSATGQTIDPPQFSEDAAVTVVMASAGYPGSYKKGIAVQVDHSDDAKFFFAGVRGEPSALVTSGGRVVSVSATAKSVSKAREKAYQATKNVRFEGGFCRRDIAASV